MSQIDLNALNEEITTRLGATVPDHPAQDIDNALRVAEMMELRGYTFKLRDLCPKSLDAQWGATLSKDGKDFTAQDIQASVAVCQAILKALKG